MYVIHRFVVSHGYFIQSQSDLERYAGWEFIKWLDESNDGKLYKEHFNRPITLVYDNLNYNIGVEVKAPLTEEEAMFFELIRTYD